jgi:hypothetical protein
MRVTIGLAALLLGPAPVAASAQFTGDVVGLEDCSGVTAADRLLERLERVADWRGR